MAILSAGHHAADCDLLHVKTVNDQLVSSGGPSCVQCGKFELEVGIRHVWLFDEAVWTPYDINDYFNEAVKSDRIIGKLTELQSEVERLKSGRFTKDEIHNICHNLHDTVSAREFADGCADEQRKLYWEAPDADALKSLIGAPPDVQRILANLDIEDNWDFVEFDEVAQCIRHLILQLAEEGDQLDGIACTLYAYWEDANAATRAQIEAFIVRQMALPDITIAHLRDLWMRAHQTP